MMNVRHERSEAAAMHQLGAGQRHGAVGPAVESAEEGDGARSAGVPAGQLQGRLQRLRAAVGEEDALGRRAGTALGQALGQVDLRLIVEIGAGHVQQLLRLVSDRRGDMWMTVAGGRDGDAGGEIEEAIAVHVLNDGPTAALDHKRIDARVRRRDVRASRWSNACALGPGKGVRIWGTTSFSKSHIALSSCNTLISNSIVYVTCGQNRAATVRGTANMASLPRKRGSVRGILPPLTREARLFARLAYGFMPGRPRYPSSVLGPF